MLSQSTSTIQQRRQAIHRRQDSLEVPQLVTNLPGPQRSRPTTQQSSTLSPTFGRLTTQDQINQPTDINLQQSMQRAQQQSAAQPGLQQPHQHIQQQVHPHMLRMMQEQASRQQAFAQPEQAIQNIQSQIKSFYEAYPQYVNVSPQGGSPIMDMPNTTPVMVQRATTPPGAFLPTPPSTQKIGGRMMRQMDVAPMPMTLNQVPMVHIQHPATHDMPLFQEQMGSDYGYSSSYQSSLVDPTSPNMSPAKQASLRAMSMPTLFEDGSVMPSPQMIAQQQMMFAAENGYYYPDSPVRIPISPREAMLASMEVDASIEDTGISAEEVAAFISPQDPIDSKWTCLFPDCNKKFGRKENIRSHVQTHLGDRQYRCNHCNKCFVRQHDLKRHAKIHSGDKPHKCPCGNGFARQDALTRHRQRGVCDGALPGYERREVKRGRPRKNRPELADRMDKATRARKMDARRGSEDVAYMSSSSPSDSGSSSIDPFTPPHMSDSYGGADADLGTAEGVEAFIKAYRENTPPTSPASSPVRQQLFDMQVSTHTSPETFDFASPSPRQVSSHPSPLVTRLEATSTETSPALTMTSAPSQPEPSFGDSLFDWAAIEPQPSLVADAFSPAAGSESAHTDLWAEEDEAMVSQGMFGQPMNGMGLFGKGFEIEGGRLSASGDSLFDFGCETENWVLGL